MRRNLLAVILHIRGNLLFSVEASSSDSTDVTFRLEARSHSIDLRRTRHWLLDMIIETWQCEPSAYHYVSDPSNLDELGQPIFAVRLSPVSTGPILAMLRNCLASEFECSMQDESCTYSKLWNSIN